MDSRLVIGILVLLLVLAGIVFFLSGSGSGDQSGVVIEFMGQRLVLEPVSGEDIPCIGAPPGYTRGLYQEEEGDYRILYYREGDHVDEVVSWVEKRASGCGYEEIDKTDTVAMGIREVHLGFFNDNTGETLNAYINAIKATNGKTYTLVELDYMRGEGSAGSMKESESPHYTEGRSDITPPQEIRWLHQMMKEILVDIYGNAVLVSYGGPNDMGDAVICDLKYLLDRDVVPEDLDRIASGLREKGWSIVEASNGDGAINVVAMKGTTQVAVAVGVGGNGADVQCIEVKQTG